MGLLQKDPEAVGLKDIQKGAKELREAYEKENQELKDLFHSLKTDLLDEFLGSDRAHLTREHIRILHEQVRHVISVARTIGYKELVQSFKQEERILEQISDIVEQYPDIEVQSHPDLRGSLERLRGMLRQQQEMIFSHEQILHDEKQALIDILRQVDELKKDRELQRHYLKPSYKQDTEFS